MSLVGRESPDCRREAFHAFEADALQRADVAAVKPRGDLDLDTVATMQPAIDRTEPAGRLVLDPSAAQRDGFELSIVAPATPADLAIKLSGLDAALPFVAAGQRREREPCDSSSGPQGGG